MYSQKQKEKHMLKVCELTEDPRISQQDLEEVIAVLRDKVKQAKGRVKVL